MAPRENESTEEVEPEPEELLEDCKSKQKQIIRGDNLMIIDLRNYKTDGKGAHYV